MWWPNRTLYQTVRDTGMMTAAAYAKLKQPEKDQDQGLAMVGS
jgi:hypothetical protein